MFKEVSNILILGFEELEEENISLLKTSHF